MKVEVGSTEGLDTEPAYQVRRWSGVAFRLLGWAATWRPNTYLALDVDSGEVEVESWEGDGELVDDRSRVVVRMVGDDTLHVVDVEDVTPLADDEFCGGCGQIGCRAEVFS